MSRAVIDLDLRDKARRVHVRDTLRDARHDQGLSQRVLAARIGVDQPGIGRYERGDQWWMHTVMRWARGLDYQLILAPTGFPPAGRSMYWGRSADIEEALHAILGAVTATDPDRDDEWTIAKLISELAGIRSACSVSQRTLAARLGITEQSVSSFESAVHGTSIAQAQRYTRALALCAGRPDAFLNVTVELLPAAD